MPAIIRGPVAYAPAPPPPVAPTRKKPPGRRPGSRGRPLMADSVHKMTERFNEMVAEAQRRGVPLPVWAKVHTSDFGSRAGAEQRLAQLAEIMEAVK
jgi:hypothetical protein